MALKDWKKYGEDEWYRLDDKHSYIKVWKIGLSSKERKRRGILAYGFSSLIRKNDLYLKKYFKTKSQALKFAKAYMRKH